MRLKYRAPLICAAFLASLLLPAEALAAKGGSGCPTRFSPDAFRVCYFAGTDPTTGTYLGTEMEAYLGTAPRDRAFGIDRNWESGVIFSGRSANISAIWRGLINFTGGRYLFSVFSSEGVRVYIDEQLVLDKWSGYVNFTTYVVASELAAGTHTIRIHWFESPDGSPNDDSRANFRFHWDRAPAVYQTLDPENNPAHRHPISLEFFIPKEIQTCIAGVPWDGNPTGALCGTNPDRACTEDDQVRLHNPDGSIFSEGGESYIWQTNPVDPLLKPRGFRNTGEIQPNLTLRKCLDFGFTDAELSNLRNPATSPIYSFADSLREWTFGAIQPTVNVREIEPKEFTLTQDFNGLWLDWPDLQSTAEPIVTKETDWVFGLASTHEVNPENPNNIRRHTPAAAGLQRSYEFTAGIGAGYVWVPDEFLNKQSALLHEWDHTMSAVVRFLMGGNVSGDFPGAPNNPRPCGDIAGLNTLDWYPYSHEFQFDPDSPWCGEAIRASFSNNTIDWNVALVSHSLLHHFDPTLARYTLQNFTGNHCENDIQDFEEDPKNSGPACRVNAPPVVTITSPLDGSRFAEGTSISFAGSATDAEDGNVTPSLVWRSNLLVDPIGFGGSFSTILPLGSHQITATASDNASNPGGSAIAVDVFRPKPCHGPRC